MAYRIVSIENPAEVHVRDGQLVVIQDRGEVTIPVREMLVLVVCGPNIRMSTMAQTMLASEKVVTLFLGRNHHPAAMLVPVVGCARQALVSRSQASAPPGLEAELWRRIIERKIGNQADALDILGLTGGREVRALAREVLPGDADNRESVAAKQYFQFLQPGFSRRVDDPLNSALNYGYAIVRAVVAREVVCAGLVPSLGLHHRSQLNAFNLVDDLMEPYRPCIDLLAARVAGRSCRLSRKQRAALREATHLAVAVDGDTRSVVDSARLVARGFRDALLGGDPDCLRLPAVRPVEIVPAVEE